MQALAHRHTKAGHYFVVLAGCVLAGGMLTLGRVAEGFSVAVASGLVLSIVMVTIKWRAVVVWVAIAGLAFPLLQYPIGHPVLTFDRAWLLAVAIWLLIDRPGSDPARESRRVAFAGAAFVAALGVRALLTADHVRAALETWLDALVLPAILFTAARRTGRSRSQGETVLLAGVFEGALLGAMGILQRAGLLDLTHLTGGASIVSPTVGIRAAGPFTTDDMLAVALLICLAMTMYWIVTRRRGAVFSLCIGAAVLELIGLYFTYFRGAWLGAIAIVVAAVGLRAGRHIRAMSVTAVAATLAIIALSGVNPNSSLGQRIYNPQNINGRFATYREGYAIFASHPLIGVGLDQFSQAQQTVPQVVVGGVTAVDTAHNSFINVLGEDGLWGFVPLVWLTIAVGVMLRSLVVRSRGHQDQVFAACVTGGLVAFLFMSLEETTVLVSIETLFAALMLGLAAGRLDAITAESEILPVQVRPMPAPESEHPLANV